MIDFDNLKVNFPFLTFGKFNNEDVVGIVQNSNKNFIHLYCLNQTKSKEDFLEFLDLGEKWWWESNRRVPINIYLKSEFDKFKSTLKIYSMKEYEYIDGPMLSLQNFYQKKVRRRQIALLDRVISPKVGSSE